MLYTIRLCTDALINFKLICN